MTDPWRVPLLLYHGVSDDATDGFRPYNITTAAFAAHLDAIQDAGFRTVTVSEMVAQMDADPADQDRSSLAITFDDGFQDFATNALPLLRARGMRSTIYITTGYVGATSRWLDRLGEGGRAMLTWEDIAGLGDDVELGAHTHQHPELDAVSRARARDEIVESRRVLAEATGRPIDAFAYPHGYSDRTVRRLVADAGFTSATAANHAIARCDDDRFRISRIVVGGDTTPDALLRMIQEIGPAPRREALRTKGWRAARRLRALART